MSENRIIGDFILTEKALVTPFKEAIDKVTNSTTDTIKVNKSTLAELYSVYYEKNRTLLFKMFQVDEIGNSVLNLEKQKILFDSIEVKQKCQLYNTISVDSRKNFYNSLSADDAKNFKESICSQAVNDARMIEQSLLDEGLCTRDWDTQQIRDISSTKQNPILMNFESSVWD